MVNISHQFSLCEAASSPAVMKYHIQKKHTRHIEVWISSGVMKYYICHIEACISPAVMKYHIKNHTCHTEAWISSTVIKYHKKNHTRHTEAWRATSPANQPFGLFTQSTDIRDIDILSSDTTHKSSYDTRRPISDHLS